MFVIGGVWLGLATGTTIVTCDVAEAGVPYNCYFDAAPTFYCSSLVAVGLFMVPLAFVFADRKTGTSELKALETAEVVPTPQEAPATDSSTTEALTRIEAKLSAVSDALQAIRRATAADIERLEGQVSAVAAELNTVPKTGWELLLGRSVESSATPDASLHTTGRPTPPQSDAVPAAPDIPRSGE